MDYISDGCKEITGYEASAFSGDSGITFGDIIPAEDRDLVRETIAKVSMEIPHIRWYTEYKLHPERTGGCGKRNQGILGRWKKLLRKGL